MHACTYFNSTDLFIIMIVWERRTKCFRYLAKHRAWLPHYKNTPAYISFLTQRSEVCLNPACRISYSSLLKARMWDLSDFIYLDVFRAQG